METFARCGSTHSLQADGKKYKCKKITWKISWPTYLCGMHMPSGAVFNLLPFGGGV
jgi:hypothetical protein